MEIQTFENFFFSHYSFALEVLTSISGALLYATLEMLRNHPKHFFVALINKWSCGLYIINMILSTAFYSISLLIGNDGSILSAFIIGLFLPLSLRGRLYRHNQFDNKVNSTAEKDIPDVYGRIDEIFHRLQNVFHTKIKDTVHIDIQYKNVTKRDEIIQWIPSNTIENELETIIQAYRENENISMQKKLRNDINNAENLYPKGSKDFYEAVAMMLSKYGDPRRISDLISYERRELINQVAEKSIELIEDAIGRDINGASSRGQKRKLQKEYKRLLKKCRTYNSRERQPEYAAFLVGISTPERIKTQLEIQ